MKKTMINIGWGVAVVGFWLYQLFWPLVWTPTIGKAHGEQLLYVVAAIVLALAVWATVKGYGRAEKE
ncbi:hypothetical protein [Schleiferilactobacillus perolens]|uniref:hypothetical protein n=1 Tax=Schleiferilactobacillus perolens TaxID=100468 RepID=UPI002357DE51|nr:hypothetical protein [Schleiferilactobacillus perolens]MCI2172190.1 hypothetical protein [Schleiferilactobacillus perolens]